MSARMIATFRDTKAARARRKRRRARCRDYDARTWADHAALRCSNCGVFIERHWFPRVP